VPIVYTGGTFDLFHSGHVNFLRQCREIADKDDQFGKVVVSLNTDEFILDYKHSSPICDYSEREAVLLGCRYVDAVVPNIGGKDSKPAILNVAPNFIVIGSDWANRDYCAQMMFTSEWLSEKQIDLVYVPYTEAISTSEIKRRLMN
jgi:glycerol-3-phosphate cytidylyltransferase